jgi:hypothetical protein
MSDELVGLTGKEIELLRVFVENNVRFIVVGMGAAILQSAPGVTQDLDLWFAKRQGEQLGAACRIAGATYYWRNNPPKIAGPGIEQIDVVWHCDGLRDFEMEYEEAIEISVAPGIVLKVLPLDRVLASKKAAGRAKDKAAIPMLRDAIRLLKKR